MPIAEGKTPGYVFWRNVADFGAKGDGSTDDTKAINAATSAVSKDVATFGRCGEECGSTFATGAIVYFPVSK